MACFHHFKKSLAIENNFRNTQAYIQLHEKLISIFPSLYDVQLNSLSRTIYNTQKDKEINKSGVDVSYQGTILSTHKSCLVKLDEKFRFKWYGDILLETISNDKTGKVGWSLDESKQNDLVLYVIVPEKIAFVWLQKRILKGLKENTIKRIKTFSANNRTYNTINVSVSVSDIIAHRGVQFSYE